MLFAKSFQPKEIDAVFFRFDSIFRGKRAEIAKERKGQARNLPPQDIHFCIFNDPSFRNIKIP